MYDDFKVKKPFACDVLYKLIQRFNNIMVKALN